MTYPGWGFDPCVFDALAERLPDDNRELALVWSAGAYRFWADLARGGAPARAVLFAPVARYVNGADFDAGVDPRSLALLRRRVERDPAAGFAWFCSQVFEGQPPTQHTTWPAERLLAGLDELARRDDRDRIERLSGTLEAGVVVTTAADRIVPAAQSRCVAKLLGLPVIELPGCSHAPFVEHTEDVADRLHSILAR